MSHCGAIQTIKHRDSAIMAHFLWAITRKGDFCIFLFVLKLDCNPVLIFDRFMGDKNEKECFLYT